jgi:hypothetical protein
MTNRYDPVGRGYSESENPEDAFALVERSDRRIWATVIGPEIRQFIPRHDAATQAIFDVLRTSVRTFRSMQREVTSACPIYSSEEKKEEGKGPFLDRRLEVPPQFAGLYSWLPEAVADVTANARLGSFVVFSGMSPCFSLAWDYGWMRSFPQQIRAQDEGVAQHLSSLCGVSENYVEKLRGKISPNNLGPYENAAALGEINVDSFPALYVIREELPESVLSVLNGLRDDGVGMFGFLRSVLFQVTHALEAARNAIRFVHGNLDVRNVRVKYLDDYADRDWLFVDPLKWSRIPKSEHRGYLVKICDFSRCAYDAGGSTFVSSAFGAFDHVIDLMPHDMGRFCWTLSQAITLDDIRLMERGVSAYEVAQLFALMDGWAQASAAMTFLKQNIRSVSALALSRADPGLEKGAMAHDRTRELISSQLPDAKIVHGFLGGLAVLREWDEFRVPVEAVREFLSDRFYRGRRYEKPMRTAEMKRKLEPALYSSYVVTDGARLVDEARAQSGRFMVAMSTATFMYQPTWKGGKTYIKCALCSRDPRFGRGAHWGVEGDVHTQALRTDPVTIHSTTGTVTDRLAACSAPCKAILEGLIDVASPLGISMRLAQGSESVAPLEEEEEEPEDIPAKKRKV